MRKEVGKLRKVREIKALIQLKYDTEAEAARELGWSRQHLNRITTGRKEPDIQEVKQLANLLGRTWGEIATIFLIAKSPNEQHHGAGDTSTCNR